MKHIFLIIGLVSVLTFPAEAKGRPTVISAEIYGYVRDQVYFDFLEKEGINMEFPYKEGQVIEFTVDLDDVTTLVLNTFIEMYLQPGDSIHVKLDLRWKTLRVGRVLRNPGSGRYLFRDK